MTGGEVYGADSKKGEVVATGETGKVVVVKVEVKGQGSPHETMLSFLKYYEVAYQAGLSGEEDKRAKAMARVLSCLDLGTVNKNRGWKYAIKLMGIFNKLSEYPEDTIEGWDGEVMRLMDLDDLEISNETARNEAVYFNGDLNDFDTSRAFAFDEYEDVKAEGKITLVNQEGVWRFSADTVKGLHRLGVSLAGVDVIEGLRDTSQGEIDSWLKRQVNRFFPASIQDKSYLTLELWQWVTLFGFIFTGIVIEPHREDVSTDYYWLDY